jgi:hypothetical protein
MRDGKKRSGERGEGRGVEKKGNRRGVEEGREERGNMSVG